MGRIKVNMEEKHFGPVWFIPGENRIGPFVNIPDFLFDEASGKGRL